jgi:hypothetical protein
MKKRKPGLVGKHFEQTCQAGGLVEAEERVCVQRVR